MSSWTPTTYKTKNWSDYNRALKKRGSLSIWFDAEMTWEAKPSGKRGRQQIYSDALDLSRFRAAPSARLSHLSFESDRAFPA